MEAHAKDKWPLGEIESVLQHKTIEDRITRAKHFQEKYNVQFPLYVDSFEANNFNDIYAAWPERFYIFTQEYLHQLGYPANEFGYDHNSIDLLLKRYYFSDMEKQTILNAQKCANETCSYDVARFNASIFCAYHLRESMARQAEEQKRHQQE